MASLLERAEIAFRELKAVINKPVCDAEKSEAVTLFFVLLNGDFTLEQRVGIWERRMHGSAA